MSVVTAWVKPPAQIGGLDHLAVQAPCINIYARLLPGITNVTDRARYYSFYPWIVWALEQAGHRYNDAFIDQYRKADCLFTLIAERHAHVTGRDRDDHAAATVGSLNLAKQIAEIRGGKSVRLSDFAHRDEGRHKYFKNKLGGLGQYYLGVFSELSIMAGTLISGVKNTNQVGAAIAQAMDKSVDRGRFLEVIRNDIVSAEDLDQLSDFCPCHLPVRIQERDLLSDLFFARALFADTDMLPRRRSLQVIMHLADHLAQQRIAIDLEHFRGCLYSGALPGGIPLELPERLQHTRRLWAVYHRNELLSLAAQGLFFVVLDAYQESGMCFHSLEALCDWFVSTPEVEALRAKLDLETTVEEFAGISSEWLPPLGDWTHENHEIQLANMAARLSRQGKSERNRSLILESALRILVALTVRPETQEGYGDLAFPAQYFQHYCINLRSLLHHAEDTWKTLTLRDWITWLSFHWGINAHLRVALRKLHGQAQSTFRIRPSDRGLEVISVPEAVFTSPRFYQSLRILKDIGALIREDGYWITSDFGQKLKGFTGE
jgi:hypothetical protein